MQSILSFSKYALFAVLSFCFLSIWYGNFNVEYFNTINTFNAANISAFLTYADTTTIIREHLTQPLSENLSRLMRASKDNAAPIVGPANSIWENISHDIDLDHKTHTPQVQAEIRKLLAEKDKLNSILNAASPYIYFIYEETQIRHLPAELALIPIIESEFNPNDHSTKGATGLWQLMPQTAHELGISIKSGYDGRRNVIASTNAALAYFNDLGHFFKGNWYLAIAAYDCGQGKVQSAIKRAKSTDFTDLKLPKETQYYVPKLLAVAEIIKNPSRYGVQLPSMTNKPYFTELKTKTPVNLKALAAKAHIDLDTLESLNPDYKKGNTPKGPYILLVPITQTNGVVAELGNNVIT